MIAKRIAVIGAGGFVKEILYSLPKGSYDLYKTASGVDFKRYQVLLAEDDPMLRKKIVSSLPKDIEYMTYIDPHARILDTSTVNIGKGSIICAGSILTSNVKLGDFTHLNLNTTIGNNTALGNFVTTAQGVQISGGSTVGNSVYFGCNSACIHNVTICDRVIIGMGANVVKDIDVSGIYSKNPAVKISDYRSIYTNENFDEI